MKGKVTIKANGKLTEQFLINLGKFYTYEELEPEVRNFYTDDDWAMLSLGAAMLDFAPIHQIEGSFAKELGYTIPRMIRGKFDDQWKEKQLKEYTVALKSMILLLPFDFFMRMAARCQLNASPISQGMQNLAEIVQTVPRKTLIQMILPHLTRIDK